MRLRRGGCKEERRRRCPRIDEPIRRGSRPPKPHLRRGQFARVTAVSNFQTGSQCDMNTGSCAADRMWLVAPPKMSCLSRLWV